MEKYSTFAIMNDRICTITQYIESKPNLLAKINAINVLISSLELKLVESIDTAQYDEYQLDDGQMKVRTKYRNITDVEAGLKSLEALKQRYVNKYNGRTMVFRGGNIIC